MKTVHFLSAARSDYDLFAPVALSLAGSVRVTASVIACSGQMSPFHGMGVRQIEEDGIDIAARIESTLSSESPQARGVSAARLLQALTDFLAVARPDVLFVTGDREEHLVGALAANFVGIGVAHLHGGDRCVASDIDEVFRPAISKLAHFHFTAAESHRERLVRMGEEPSHVWATGAPCLDRLRAEPEMDVASLGEVAGFDVEKPFFLLIQHPSPTFSEGRDGEEMSEILAGVLECGVPVLCSYPNIDPGNVGIRRAIDAAAAANPLLRTYHNLPRNVFVNLYRRCSAILGNSSSLVVESTFLSKMAVLIGPRQDYRDRAENVLRVAIDRHEVAEACRRCLGDEAFREQAAAARSLYGDGESAARIVGILEDLVISPGLLRKSMPY